MFHSERELKLFHADSKAKMGLIQICIELSTKNVSENFLFSRKIAALQLLAKFAIVK